MDLWRRGIHHGSRFCASEIGMAPEGCSMPCCRLVLLIPVRRYSEILVRRTGSLQWIFCLCGKWLPQGSYQGGGSGGRSRDAVQKIKHVLWQYMYCSILLSQEFASESLR